MKYILALLNGALAIYAGYLTWAAYGLQNWQYAAQWMVVGLLVLNAVFLVKGASAPGRIRRLISLWFDAKEAELRAKAPSASK